MNAVIMRGKSQLYNGIVIIRIIFENQKAMYYQ
jgi:hypothetical protein